MNNMDPRIQKIMKDNEQSGDIKTRVFMVNNKKVSCIYLESTSNGGSISESIFKSISETIQTNSFSLFTDIKTTLENTIYNSDLNVLTKEDDLFYYLASGFTLIFIEGESEIISLETRNDLSRGISEASSEGIIRGPKDSFTENNATNLGLIRKRVKDPNLIIQETTVGKRTKSKVSTLYIKDIADIQKVNDILSKLEKINVDGILDSGNIREFLFPNDHSVFPKIISTERPDLVCSSLLNGKIVILVENTPYALIIPGLFVDYFKNPEDYYQMPSNVSFTRILRYMAFLLTITIPALYIAITTFNIEILPTNLLYSLYEQRLFVPFPTAFEIVLLLIIFEILRECDIRIPSAMGTSMSIVGGLVLGDAAVSAGIVSPITVIIVAITSISGLLFSDIDMINAVRWWRLIFIIFSTLLGMIGFFVSLVLLIIELSSQKIMGIDYLTPISPFNKIGIKDAFTRPNKSKDKMRPNYLSDKNKYKLGGKS